MNIKCILFFLVVVCLTRNFEARTVISPSSINKINIDIEEVIKKIENALFELIIQLPDIQSNLENKINNIIDSVGIAVQTKVDEILKQINVDLSTVYECANNEEAALKQFIQGLADCKKDADDEINTLNNAIEELESKTHKFIDDNVQTVKQCIDENKENLINVGICLKDHLKVIKTDAAHLIEQIMNSMEITKEKASQVSLDLTKCVAGVEGEAMSKEKVIIDEFIKCVEAHKQEQ